MRFHKGLPKAVEPAVKLLLFNMLYNIFAAKYDRNGLFPFPQIFDNVRNAATLMGIHKTAKFSFVYAQILVQFGRDENIILTAFHG